MKRATVRFYTFEGDYKGWQYLDSTTFREARAWLRSGNYLKIKNQTYGPFTSTNKLLNTFHEGVK